VKEEVSRCKSPDKKVEAILIETNGGATTPFRYLLYLVAVGNSPSKDDLVLEAIHIENFEIKWKKSKFLEIKYTNARIFHFQNIWEPPSYAPDRDAHKKAVELRLVPLGERTID
jgi:hypothetical protein